MTKVPSAWTMLQMNEIAYAVPSFSVLTMLGGSHFYCSAEKNESLVQKFMKLCWKIKYPKQKCTKQQADDAEFYLCVQV